VYQLVRAVQGREKLIARAEDLAADPEVLSDPLRRESFLTRWADRYDRSPRAAPIREHLRLAYLSIKPAEYKVLQIGLAAGLGYFCIVLLKIPLLPSVIIGVAVYFALPKIVAAVRHNAYVKAFNEQLMEVTLLLANALRAGMSIHQAIEQTTDRVVEPARSEFRQTHNELLLGDSLALALSGMCQRIKSRDLAVMVNAILIQHQAGGNLARVLRAMSTILSERQRVKKEIDTITADARSSTTIMMIMPIFLLIMIRSSPLGDALFTTWPGWILLAVFALSQFVIFLLVRRILRVEV
jgi:tight adherence protein B